MTGTALHTNEILQYLVLDTIVIAFTAKKIIKFVLISTWRSVINMRICDVLLNFFVSVYMYFGIFAYSGVRKNSDQNSLHLSLPLRTSDSNSKYTEDDINK